MNKLLLTMAFLILSGIVLTGQTKISGIVKDSSTEREIYNLNVSILETGEEVQTDRIGYFQFVDVPAGNYTIKVSGIGYRSLEQVVQVDGQNPYDMGDLMIEFNPASETIGVITLTDDELDADETSSQSSAGLLQSSQDVFDRTAAFELGAYWFKVRGYDNKYSDVFFNGVRMNKINNNRVNFGDWGGLNDVTRRPFEQTSGIEPSETAFGNVGGVTYIDTRPSLLRKGTSLSYSFSNRSYNQRVLATYNTGLMKNGWAIMGSFARRWAEEGKIDGTFYDSWAYFLGVEKKLNDRHSLTFTTFGAPTRRSTNSPNTQEVYDLMGKDYNAYWGWQNGKKRSERVRKFFEPIAFLTHHWTISDKSRLATTLAYQQGKDSRSRLDWYNANNPSPLYYRYLPSYYESLAEPNQQDIDLVYYRWLNDQSYSQINWQDLYDTNRAKGNGGAAYVLAGDINEDKIWSFNSLFKSEINPNIKYTIGVSYQNTNSHLYREVLDLLGGHHYVNRDSFEHISYNVEEDPNREVKEGDKYQYDYEINHQLYNLFTQFDMTFGKLDVSFGAKLSYTSIYRFGNYRHEQYLDNSYGKSATYDFWDLGGKARFLYKLDGRNFFQLNGMYMTIAPTSDEVFPNARSNDYTVDRNNFTNNGNNLKSQEILSTDLSYILRAPRLKGRVTGFYTKFFNNVEKNFGYIDEGTQYNKFGADYVYGIDKQFLGGEFAVEAQLSSTLTLSGVASIGQFTYANNPTHQRFSDSRVFNELEAEIMTVGATTPQTTYLKNYRVATGPQSGFSLGLQYRDPKYWWVGATANYLAGNYLAPAPFRRTSSVWGGNDPSDYPEELVNSFLSQQKFSNEFMLNINVGKTFRIGKYFAGLSASVNNVLDNRDYVTGGFEQIRVGSINVLQDNPSYSKIFGPKLWYDRGRSYFINAFFRF